MRGGKKNQPRPSLLDQGSKLSAEIRSFRGCAAAGETNRLESRLATRQSPDA